jgi:hypothetical protein
LCETGVGESRVKVRGLSKAYIQASDRARYIGTACHAAHNANAAGFCQSPSNTTWLTGFRFRSAGWSSAG